MKTNYIFEKPTAASLGFPIVATDNFSVHGQPEKSYIPNHWHKEVELFFLNHGSAMITLNDASHYIEADQFILILPGTVHSVHSVYSKPFFYSFINFDIKLLKGNATNTSELFYTTRIDEYLSHLEYIVKKDSDKGTQIISIFKKLLELLKKKPNAYEIGVIGYLELIIFNTINGIALQRKDDLSNELQPVLEYIENNFMNNITLDLLSNFSNMSKYYFIRLFHKTCGMTPIEYINKIRINKACDLLSMEEDMKILDIALAVGFNDLSYFNRLFKRIIGVPPQKYRQQSRAQNQPQPAVLFGESHQAVPFYTFML